MAFEENKENIKEGEDLEKSMDNLKRVFHSNGILLKPAPAKSSWRLGAVESQQKLFKTALKRSHLYHQKLKMTDWMYVLARIENEINSRGICLNYMEESFSMVTPLNLLFGAKKDDLPRDINLDGRNDDLFEAVKKIDKEIDQWTNLYHRTYALQTKKFFKWKRKRTLDRGDVCYVLDRINEAGTFTLAIVTDILSDRTYEIEYCKKSARVDKKTYKITRSAKKSKLIRPINNLVFICKKSECTNVNIDVFEMDESGSGDTRMARQVTDQMMEEDEIFMEDPGVNEDVDHNLDDMIVADKPEDVVDEITREENSTNHLEENGGNNGPDRSDAVTEEIVDVEDEVVVTPQNIMDMENKKDTNQEELHKMEIKKPITIQFAGDDEIKDVMTNPKAQDKSGKEQKKRKKRKRMNW